MGLAAWLAACGGSGSGPTAMDLAAHELGAEECGVCGMVVREQPSPRGQLVHRDGAHVFFCSLGDLRAYTQHPGPRGAPAATWVETVDDTFDPASRDTAPHPWIPAADALYVVGFERPMVMGRPTVALPTRDAADRVAANLGGRVVTWDRLQSTAFDADPKEGTDP